MTQPDDYIDFPSNPIVSDKLMKHTHPTSSAEPDELTDSSNPVTPANHADKYSWRTSNELSGRNCLSG